MQSIDQIYHYERIKVTWQRNLTSKGPNEFGNKEKLYVFATYL